MAQKLTRNLLSHVDVKGYSLVLVKEPAMKKSVSLPQAQPKEISKENLIVSAKKENIAIKVKGKATLTEKERKTAKTVVDSVRVGVKKTEKLNTLDKKMIKGKTNLSRDDKENKPAGKTITLKDDQIKDGSKISKGDSSIKTEELLSKRNFTFKGNKASKNISKKSKGSMLLSEKTSDKPKDNEKMPDLKEKNVKESRIEKSVSEGSDPNLQSLLIQTQKSSFKTQKLEAKFKNADSLKTLDTRASKQNVLQKDIYMKGNSNLKQQGISKGSFQKNSDFSNSNFKKSNTSKNLVRDLEKKFLKAMSFKRVVDKTKIKLTSKTQRMQLTLGKTIQTTNITQAVHQVPDQTTTNVNTHVSSNSNIQKPFTPDQNVLQRFENVQKISNMIKSLTPQNKVMTMRLDPPNLGNVEVRLITHGKEVLVNFIVKDSDLKDVIKNTSQLLTTQLKANTNYQRIQINVQAQDNQNQQFHQRNGNQNQNQQQQQQKYYQQGEEETEDDDH